MKQSGQKEPLVDVNRISYSLCKTQKNITFVTRNDKNTLYLCKQRMLLCTVDSNDNKN